MKRKRKTATAAKTAKSAISEDIHVGYADPQGGSRARRGILGRVRFLPLVIFAAALMLPLKLNSVWEGLGDILDRSQSVALAQQADMPLPGGDLPAPGGEMPAPPDGMAAGGEMPMSGGPETNDAVAARLLNEDPTLLTQAEIELLQQLAERRETLDGRARELEVREGMLKAAEARIDKKISEFKVLQSTIEGLIKKYDDQQDSKIKSLVKIYENMKPKDAARIFEELDMDTLLSVAERMSERKLAPVMAQMNPSKAREVTVELSTLRDIPKSGENSGG